MLKWYVSTVVSYISECTSGGEYDILTLQLALSQLHIFLLVDELARSKIKTRLCDICSTQEQTIPGWTKFALLWICLSAVTIDYFEWGGAKCFSPIGHTKLPVPRSSG